MTSAIVRSARATGLLVSGAVTAGAALLGLAFAVVVGVACLALIGLPWLPDMIRPLRQLAGAERRRVSRVTGWQVPEPYHAV
ncbi:MAG: sensor domain-containing protein, partial [Trebonia sp.]